jgi:tRNA A37 threonylcarbamoyladenosine dehydratase
MRNRERLRRMREKLRKRQQSRRRGVKVVYDTSSAVPPFISETIPCKYSWPSVHLWSHAVGPSRLTP